METPLLAFLIPFSPELWMAIFVSLNITALAVAIYEWLSPFGLNPWGRQRTKNFSYGSALWVIWGLLFSHLVAFKAPKSWPNKVLINVWGAFSVIFVASYTANIAALFAGLFNRRDTHGTSFYSLRMGAIRFSASEFYVSMKDPSLWAHIKGNLVANFTQALDYLNSGRLDLLLGDAAILDHMRANDPGCTLQSAGPAIVDDIYAVAMPKGFPLKMRINAAISQYMASGHLEYLRHKWYGSSPCFRITADIYKPQPLEFDTVSGVFLMLTLGIIIGIVILFLEHVVYRYALVLLRRKPKGSVWRNRNLMFFSQKLYKFINCYELVSPHHSAKELVNNLRTGQIMGLFQKSVKKKEIEQRRRRKSKAQFFEMIQEIRRVQKEEKSLETMTSSMEVLDPTLHVPASFPPESSSMASEVLSAQGEISTPVTSSNERIASTPVITMSSNKALSSSTPTTAVVSVSPTPFSHYSSSTTVSSNLSSSAKRIPTLAFSGGERKSPSPGITIDYIPGPNVEEDSEGILIVNKNSQGASVCCARTPKVVCRSHLEREMNDKAGKRKIREKYEEGSKHKHADKKDTPSRKSTKEEEEEGGRASVEGRNDGLEGVSRKSSSSSREARKKRKNKKLERSSRIENFLEDNGSDEPPSGLKEIRTSPKAFRDFNASSEDNGNPSDTEGADKDETMNFSVSPLLSAVSAPASLFGEDSSCECDHLSKSFHLQAPEPHLTLPKLRPMHVHRNVHHSPSNKDCQIKSKSLDETEILPPSDFMSPALSPVSRRDYIGRDYTSMSFPCSPHVLESPPSESTRPSLHHFLSEGDDRWFDWENRDDLRFPSDPAPIEKGIYAGFPPSGQPTSGCSYQVVANPNSPRRYTFEPFHLRNMTKKDLWLMWQDSELELRQQLFRLEEERNLLASQLFQSYSGVPEPKDSTMLKDEHRSEEFESASITEDPNLQLELEVPYEFRDSASKDLRKNRCSRSFEDGRTCRSHMNSNFDYYGENYSRCDDLLKIKDIATREYDDFCRSVRSLEDSLLADNDMRSESRRKSLYNKVNKSKSSRRKREPLYPRRCKSSLDSRRSKFIAISSESSESPTTEKVSITSREVFFSSREVSRKKSSMPSVGDYSEKHLASKEQKRRKSRSIKGDKLPSSSLPRNRSHCRRKYSSTLSYCSKSSDSDEESNYGRQYTESSPLPLLQSLQRHSLSKQQRTGLSQNQKQKPKHADMMSVESRYSKKGSRKASFYVERAPYRGSREKNCVGSCHMSHYLPQPSSSRGHVPSYRSMNTCGELPNLEMTDPSLEALY